MKIAKNNKVMTSRQLVAWLQNTEGNWGGTLEYDVSKSLKDPRIAYVRLKFDEPEIVELTYDNGSGSSIDFAIEEFIRKFKGYYWQWAPEGTTMPVYWR